MAEVIEDSSLLTTLQPLLITLGLIILAVVILCVLGVAYHSYHLEHGPANKLFRSGSLPEPSPNGFYRGNQNSGLGKQWQGKIFDPEAHTGINQFAGEQRRYKFKTYAAKGLRDHDKQVLRIDYNQPGNPWWLHFIVDEVVQVGKDKYQGKVHVHLLGLTFTLTYFELQK